MAIRVLLVGRHEALLEGLRARLTCETDLAVHIHAAGLEQAPACLRANEIDVVVMDGDCALDAALSLARQARTMRPACSVLLIESTQINPWRDVDCSDLLRGLIGRQDLPHCLPEAVRTVGERGVYLSPEVRSRAERTDCGLRYISAQVLEHTPGTHQQPPRHVDLPAGLAETVRATEDGEEQSRDDAAVRERSGDSLPEQDQTEGEAGRPHATNANTDAPRVSPDIGRLRDSDGGSGGRRTGRGADVRMSDDARFLNDDDAFASVRSFRERAARRAGVFPGGRVSRSTHLQGF